MTTVAPPAYHETRSSSDVPPYTAGDYKKVHLDILAARNNSAESSPSSSDNEKRNEGRDGWSIWTSNVKSAASKAKSVWGAATGPSSTPTNVWGRAGSGRVEEDTNVWGPVIAAKTQTDQQSFAAVWGNGQGIHGRDAAERKI